MICDMKLKSHMHKIVFQNIPCQLKELKNSICNPLIEKLYSNFTFSYFSCDSIYSTDKKSVKHTKEELYKFIYDFLSNFKFFVYDFINSSKYLTLEEESLLSIPISSSSKTNIIICVEKQCLIIEQIEFTIINQILKELKSSHLNVTADIEDDITSNDEKYAKEEIKSFCSKFVQLINTNPFVRFTINSIVGYSIRRFFYPSNFFNDQSFFQFDANKKIQSQLFDIRISKKLTELFELINEDEIGLKIFDYRIYEFTEKDFIFLRPIYVNESFSFNLVIHIEAFYIFLVKKIIYLKDMSKVNHEINFCLNHKHRSFTQFYGFVKKDEKIIGFVYEFMSNGNLSKYVHDHSNEIDNIFSILTMVRIFEGIEYLHSNSLIHRDLKPLNILLDHNNLPFISDFETIRLLGDNDKSKENFTFDFVTILYSSPEQYNNEVISYSTDIYSFGLIVYFLFEKKDILQIQNEIFIYESIKNKNIPKISNVSINIQKLYELNVNYNKEKRLSLEDNKNLIIDDLYSTSYLDDYLIKNYQSEKISNEIIQFFIEIIHFDGNNSVLFYGLLHNFIKLYYNGLGCQKDYKKAGLYFELSARKNNL